MDKYYAIYSRKSKFTGIGESIENQITLCKNHLINKYGEKIKDQIIIYEDEGYTGYNTKRPKFQQMMQDIRDKKIKAVIVYRLDRISRNVSNFCNLKDELAKYEVDFISVTENFDTSTPMGMAMLMITSVFAQLERDTIAERIKDNMYELAKTGRWLGGTTPLGFKSLKEENIDIDGKKRSLYKLEPIPEEVKTIKLIWEKMLELKGLNKLESYLLQQGIKTRTNHNFTRFALVTILKNPVYVKADANIKNFFKNLGATVYGDDASFDNKHGLIAYNKSLETPGKAKVKKEIPEWIIAVGKHPGIISSSQFIKVWEILANNQNKRMRMPPQNTSILSGLIKCHYCGSYMRPKLLSTYTGDIRNFSYLCELKDKSRKKLCKCPNLNGIKTDQLIMLKIKEFTISPTKIIPILKKKIHEKRMKDSSKEPHYNLTETEITTLAQKAISNYLTTFNRLDVVSKRILLKLLISSVESDGKNLYLNLVGSLSGLKKPRSAGSRSYP